MTVAPRSRALWTSQDINSLLNWAKEGVSIEDMAARLGRSRPSIIGCLQKIKEGRMFAYDNPRDQRRRPVNYQPIEAADGPTQDQLRRSMAFIADAKRAHPDKWRG